MELATEDKTKAFASSFEEVLFPGLKSLGFFQTPFLSGWFGKDKRGVLSYTCYRVDERETLTRLDFHHTPDRGQWQIEYVEYHLDKPIEDLKDLSKKSGTYLVQDGRYRHNTVQKKRDLWIIKPPVNMAVGRVSSIEEYKERCNALSREWVDVFENDIDRLRDEWRKWCGPKNPISWEEWPEEGHR